MPVQSATALAEAQGIDPGLSVLAVRPAPVLRRVLGPQWRAGVEQMLPGDVVHYARPRRCAALPGWRWARARFAGAQAQMVLRGAKSIPLPTPKAPEGQEMPKPCVWTVLRSPRQETGVFHSWRVASHAVLRADVLGGRRMAHGGQEFDGTSLFHGWPSQIENWVYICEALGYELRE